MYNDSIEYFWFEIFKVTLIVLAVVFTIEKRICRSINLSWYLMPVMYARATGYLEVAFHFRISPNGKVTFTIRQFTVTLAGCAEFTFAAFWFILEAVVTTVRLKSSRSGVFGIKDPTRIYSLADTI